MLPQPTTRQNHGSEDPVCTTYSTAAECVRGSAPTRHMASCSSHCCQAPRQPCEVVSLGHVLASAGRVSWLVYSGVARDPRNSTRHWWKSLKRPRHCTEPDQENVQLATPNASGTSGLRCYTCAGSRMLWRKCSGSAGHLMLQTVYVPTSRARVDAYREDHASDIRSCFHSLTPHALA